MDESTKAKIAATAALISSLAAGPAPAADNNIPMKQIGGDNIGIVKGQNPQKVSETDVSFRTDLRDYSIFTLTALSTKDLTAVIFDENVKDMTRECPFIDTSARLKEIKQVGDEMVFETRTTASPAEYNAVAKANCIIAPTVKLKEIQFN